MQELIEKFIQTHKLERDEYEMLIVARNPQIESQLASVALNLCESIYGNQIYIRGLIEFTNYCKNDCLYCGLRCSNRELARYRLTEQQILECAQRGHELGFRTFVLQGGEDSHVDDTWLTSLIQTIKDSYPDSALTLSLGERSRESYEALRQAGADRYLLRHETASEDHYAKLHPASMRLESRMNCIDYLRELDYAVGVGFMVDSPFQTPSDLAADLYFIQEFAPEMCGIGPFVPHHATPFADQPQGSVDLTCFLLSLIRIMHPHILLPATTALSTIDSQGREKAIMAGANVVMPNLSPVEVRKNYELYDDKCCLGAEASEGMDDLAEQLAMLHKQIVVDRGDPL